MTNQKTPREWFIYDGGSGFQALGVVARGPEFSGHVEVIEHSAYLAEKTKREQWEKLAEETNVLLEEMRDSCSRDLIQVKIKKALDLYEALKMMGEKNG